MIFHIEHSVKEVDKTSCLPCTAHLLSKYLTNIGKDFILSHWRIGTFKLEFASYAWVFHQRLHDSIVPYSFWLHIFVPHFRHDENDILPLLQ